MTVLLLLAKQPTIVLWELRQPVFPVKIVCVWERETGIFNQSIKGILYKKCLWQPSHFPVFSPGLCGSDGGAPGSSWVSVHGADWPSKQLAQLRATLMSSGTYQVSHTAIHNQVWFLNNWTFCLQLLCLFSQIFPFCIKNIWNCSPICIYSL